MAKISQAPPLIQDIVRCLGEDAIIYYCRHGDNQIIQAHWEIGKEEPVEKQRIKELEIWVRKDLLQDLRDVDERFRAKLLAKSFIT